MEKRVTFKNASNQTNKRARLTHSESGVVNVGNQTGAVYYENPELGMCYSKPMEITATVNEETQCISLVGLYDLFIDGKRIGRGMTQEEILERVNAGDYGVEVSPCLTVSCDGAPGKTNCLSLTGLWDVEINDTRIIENADEKRILAALKKNPLIRTEECRPKCVSTGEIILKMPAGEAERVFTEVITDDYTPSNSAYLSVTVTDSYSNELFQTTVFAGDDTEYRFNGLKSVAIDKLNEIPEFSTYALLTYNHIPETGNIELTMRSVTGRAINVVIQFQTETVWVHGINATIGSTQPTFPVNSEVVMVAKLTAENPDDVRYQIQRFIFRSSFMSLASEYTDRQIAWRAESQDPWTVDYLLMALAEIDLPGFMVSKTPDDFEIGSLNYCKDGLINYESRIFFQNTYALSRETYYYTGGWALYLGSLTIPIVHMKLDGVELTPYTWTPSGQERTVIERAALEHFKTQLEARGITCSIIDDVRTNTPPAFNGGPVTSTLSLVVNANYRFSITTSKQWEGTASHPELNNAQNGWEEKSIGMHAYGQGFSSTGFATANGCSLGAASAQEVDLSVQIHGISENGPVPRRGTFTLRPTTLEFVSLASEGIVLQSGQTDILTVFPQLATQEPLPTCGYYIVEEEGPA